MGYKRKSGLKYSLPLNNAGVRSIGASLLPFKIPVITLQLALLIHGSASVDLTNQASSSTGVQIYFLKSTYKWTSAFHTHIVQGSNVFLYCFYQRNEKNWDTVNWGKEDSGKSWVEGRVGLLEAQFWTSWHWDAYNTFNWRGYIGNWVYESEIGILSK